MSQAAKRSRSGDSDDSDHSYISASETVRDSVANESALELEIESENEAFFDLDVGNEDEIKAKIEKSRELMKFLLQEFSEEQLQRYETFRRAGFQRTAIKRFCNSLVNQPLNANAVIIMSGISKVFTGELVEIARQVQTDWNDGGALLPSHVREAYRRMKKMSIAPCSSIEFKKPMFL